MFNFRAPVFWAMAIGVGMSLLIGGCTSKGNPNPQQASVQAFMPAPVIQDASTIPQFTGNPCTTLNGNMPYFAITDAQRGNFEDYAELDELGRCGVAYANVCPAIMPKEKRGPIGMVKPSGWHTVRYDDLVEGKYLYNRCHLIAYQLAGENANVKNLITGTRYLNNVAMLPIENMVADYVKKTGNHVLYRVTPVFATNELVARGVVIEALSVEDNGAGVCLNVFCHNVQPGIVIDYATGDSKRA